LLVNPVSSDCFFSSSSAGLDLGKIQKVGCCLMVS